ncbi:unnamed protein product [Sphagnum troendelagicum]|uniref:Secreted protein n=1 Tax=Sphagnum troendelagicum TaxID=128251 RepID=A0ABP0T7C7_9BRYO
MVMVDRLPLSRRRSPGRRRGLLSLSLFCIIEGRVYAKKPQKEPLGLVVGEEGFEPPTPCYPLRTWLPSVYRGHDNWYTRGASFPVLSY